MKKFLVLVLVLGLSALVYWYGTSEKKTGLGSEAAGSTGGAVVAKDTLAPTSLAPEEAAQPGSKGGAARETSAPDRLAGPPEIVAKYGTMDRQQLQGAANKLRDSLRETREQQRQEGNAASHRTTVSAPLQADPEKVRRENTPPGQLGDAVLVRRDKEGGRDEFDLYLYTRDEVPEWAAAEDELDWIEARLKTLR